MNPSRSIEARSRASQSAWLVLVALLTGVSIWILFSHPLAVLRHAGSTIGFKAETGEALGILVCLLVAVGAAWASRWWDARWLGSAPAVGGVLATLIVVVSALRASDAANSAGVLIPNGAGTYSTSWTAWAGPCVACVVVGSILIALAERRVGVTADGSTVSELEPQ